MKDEFTYYCIFDTTVYAEYAFRGKKILQDIFDIKKNNIRSIELEIFQTPENNLVFVLTTQFLKKNDVKKVAVSFTRADQDNHQIKNLPLVVNTLYQILTQEEALRYFIDKIKKARIAKIPVKIIQ